MLRIKSATLLFGFLLLAGMAANAQTPLSLYYLENIPQSSFINPAMAPRANGFIGFPVINSFYTAIRSDLFGPNFIQEIDNQGYTLLKNQYDYDKLYKGIGKAANFGINQTLAPIIFGFSGKKGYFTFGITEKMSVAFNLPKSFFQMAEKGLRDVSLDFSPFGLNASYYREYSAGYSYQFTSKIRVGAHVKLLQGIFSTKTDIERFDLNTSLKEWSVDAKAAIYASAPMEVTLNENGIPEDIAIKEFDGVGDYLDVAAFNFSNPGVAFDVGAVYDLNEAWTFSGSLNDLGFIKWSSNLNSFSLDGKYTFNAESININIDNYDSINVVVEQMVDSIETVLNYSHGEKGFSTGLGPQLYLGAKYNLNHSVSFGALSRTVFKKYDFQQEFNVSANVNLYHILTTTLNYTVSLSGASSVGFGLGLRGGPVQFYFLADYLPTSYRNYIIQNEDDQGKVEESKFPGPVSFENFNIMWGLNIILGANGYKDSPMIDAYSEF